MERPWVKILGFFAVIYSLGQLGYLGLSTIG